MYRIVVGWYPSFASAEKVFNHVKGKCNHVHIEEEGANHIVVLEYNTNIDELKEHRDMYQKKGICCGIEVHI